MKQEIRTQIYYVFRTFWVSLALMFALTAIFGAIAVAEKSPVLGTIGFIVAIFLTLLFMSKIKALFTKGASIIFDKDSFTISTFRLGGEEKMKSSSFKWEDLKSYKIYFSNRNLTYVDLFFRDGGFKEFVFKEGKTLDESLHSGVPSLLQGFRSFIKDYNRQVEKEAQISLSSGLLTTKMGTFWLIIIGVLIMVAFVLTLVIKRSSAGFLLIGLGAYLPLLAKRQRDLALYKKMSELDPGD